MTELKSYESARIRTGLCDSTRPCAAFNMLPRICGAIIDVHGQSVSFRSFYHPTIRTVYQSIE